MTQRSLQVQLALVLGIGVTVLWLSSAWVTSRILHWELDEVFDSALEETAQRLLPLAVTDILGREDPGVSQRIASLRAHEEFYTYLVRDAEGRVLMASHQADPTDFPVCATPGLAQTDTHRLYCDTALQGTVVMTVAEPLSHRAGIAREVAMALGLPILLVIPLALTGLIAVVRHSFRHVRRLREVLGTRGARDLSPIDGSDLPAEIAPLTAAVNQLLDRLREAFEAERAFAVHAAHELRTPVAGATAQAQRIRIETSDPKAARRAAEIEATLKRLTRLSEKLMQLARAEGGRVTSQVATDLRPILRLVITDFARAGAEDRIELDMAEGPVLSRIDPDAFAILCRNLIENALRHGDEAPVEVALRANGQVSVRNGGAVVAPEALCRLTRRFERAPGAGEGSGLGLAIVRTIIDRLGGTLTLNSPRPGQPDGFEVTLGLPV